MREENSSIPLRDPPWNAFRVFEAAARLDSFAQAAIELHVTQGAVSRQIKQLESTLGFSLLERRNRGVFLTAQGAVLFEACHQMKAAVTDAMRKLAAPAEQLPLVLSCEPTIAIRWLVPRLPDFRARHPHHEIHLLTAGGPVDFHRDHIDIALRRNDFNWGASFHAESVAPERVGPVGAPSLRQRKPDGKSQSGLPPQRLLHARSRRNAWQQWSDAAGQTVASSGAEHYEHFYLSLQAASAGLGLAIGSAYMAADDLLDERLAAPFGFVADGSEYVLLSPVPFDRDKRRLAFLNWIRDAMAETLQSIDKALPPA